MPDETDGYAGTMTTTTWPLMYEQIPGQDFLTGATYSLIEYGTFTKSRAQILDDIFREYEQEWKELANL